MSQYLIIPVIQLWEHAATYTETSPKLTGLTVQLEHKKMKNVCRSPTIIRERNPPIRKNNTTEGSTTSNSSANSQVTLVIPLYVVRICFVDISYISIYEHVDVVISNVK